MSGGNYRAVFIGVTGRPSFDSVFKKYAKSIGLPYEVIPDILSWNELVNKFETGIYATTEFIELFDKHGNDKIQAGKIKCKKFSTEDLLKLATEWDDVVYQKIITSVNSLRKNGLYVTAVINNWIEDRVEYKADNSRWLTGLKTHFNAVLESSKMGVRKPDVSLFDFDAEVKPVQTIVLDNDKAVLKNAEKLGIKAIDCNNIKVALTELEKETGVKLDTSTQAHVYPMPCRPDNVPHAIVEVRPGVKLHYIDIGTGPVVMLFHGFPEMWYAWRYQITALCEAGYRVIAMDQKGYGDSSCPDDIDAYTKQELCKDAIGLMDCLKIPMCVIVGHDWGGAVIWNLATKHPDRVRAVASINTPRFSAEAMEVIKENRHRFIYQQYFQSPGVAEKELEKNLRKSFNFMLQNFPRSDGFGDVMEKGSLMADAPDDIRSNLLSELDLEYYIKQFTKSGFRGPLNWYRTQEEDGRWRSLTQTRKIMCPALMITTENDTILIPAFTKGMENDIPNLSRAHLTDCGHWAIFEKPDKVSKELIEWLAKLKI